MPEQTPDHIDTSILFKSLLRNAKGTGIFLLDREGKVLDVNIGINELIGYNRAEIIGKNISVLYEQEDQAQGVPLAQIRKSQQEGSSISNNFLSTKEGLPLWVHSETIYSEDSGTASIIKIIHNVNYQKELEKELVQKNNDFNSFVYVASHDLKGPISNIEGLVSMLPDVVKNEESFQQIFELLQVSVDKFKALLEDLPSLAKKPKKTN